MVMLLALSPAPASAANRRPGGLSALQTCSSTYIYARANYKFVSAVINESGGPLRARADSWGAWEDFGVATYNGKYVFYSWAAGLYVSANISGAGGGALQATASSVGPWEQFTIEGTSDGWYAIKSAANSKYVTANISGGNNGALRASADKVGTWERFDLFFSC
ncbi:hypothetical protein [Micromonospora sp. WMMD714]|uniref:fascin domain-containing protein n=1 Tax=Micromonospora sp. WMMD714 TaxID=3016097 RepID=UPI00249BAF00|nr:hypothetical protein [Micromonospora sp. WMMD714]WFE63365.1 hypothetical protein O7625_08750 [Micromonospora sp. WMMD714]